VVAGVILAQILVADVIIAEAVAGLELSQTSSPVQLAFSSTVDIAWKGN
jgi:hypothetical protein